jgi:nitroimidazol reductase NimA-like FMN-containing flavoprotein (pyridoxamine 5'-phosphate oxidase superfamily)
MKPEDHEKLNQPWVKEFLAEKHLARLGTANPQTAQPHVTPVWFDWDGECVYISAFISTRKAKEVQHNARISVLIDIAEQDGPTRAVLFEGRAEFLDDPVQVAPLAKQIYTKYVGPEGINAADVASWIIDAENRIIKLAPEHVYIWGW